MTREELLKEIMKLPKVETDNQISTMNSINVDDLMSAVDRLNKVPDYNDLLKENQELKKHLKVPKAYNLKTLEDYKSYYEDITREQILEDTYIEYCAYVNLAHRYSELKKQLEEWEHHLKCSKEMLDIQGQKGNYDYDEYMLGVYNGMEYIIALFETREPNFISGKDVEFTNNRTQQKEFIKYLEEKEKQFDGADPRLAGACSGILQKYKEITGVSDEKK